MARSKFKQAAAPVASEEMETQASSMPNSNTKAKNESEHSIPKRQQNKSRMQRNTSNMKNQAQAISFRLNKRQRRLERTAADQAMAATHTVPDTSVVQENLSCNWQLLQQVLNREQPSTVISQPQSNGNKKRRRTSSSAGNEDEKRSRLVDSPTSSDSGTVDDTDTADTEITTNEAIIDSLIREDGILQRERRKGPEKEAWFDGVPAILVDNDIKLPDESDGEDAVEVDMDTQEELLDSVRVKNQETNTLRLQSKIQKALETVVAMDCEMVGVGPDGIDSALARVSIVDRLGNVLFDKFVQPVEPVTDYRTKYSGIRPENLVDATPFQQVQAEVSKLLKGRMLVGHALRNDLSCLFLSHPIHAIRDTSRYPPFRSKYNNYSPSLKNLCRDFLGVAIQEGEHDSVTDARAAMRLYTLHHAQWEDNLSKGGRGHFKKVTMKGAKKVKGAPGSRKKKRCASRGKLNKPHKHSSLARKK